MSGHGEERHADGAEARGSPASSLSSSLLNEETEKYYINRTLFEALQGKGFSDNAIKKSIVAGCIDEGTCTQWITMHKGHPELDSPLGDGVEVIVKSKRVLTEAEREAKVRELQEKVRLKKEEAKRLAAEEERRRIEMGKKALETHEMREKLRREAELAAVRKQKEDDAIARRRVKVQILADKYTRQGMPPEEARRAAEMELEEIARQRREQLLATKENFSEGAPETATHTEVSNVHNSLATRALSLRDVFDKPAASVSSLPDMVNEIRNHPDATLSRQCVAALRTILTNIRDNPFDTAKRSLKTSTNAFCTKIAPLTPAIHFLQTCGFQLVTDADGNELVAITTVVIRVIERALALLSS